MRKLLLIAVGCLWSAPSLAWNNFGHMEVAAVAWTQLSPQAKKEATRLLKLNPQYKQWTKGVSASQRDQIAFVKAATWPDEIKTLKNYHNDGDRGGDVATKKPEASQNIGYSDHFRHRYWHFIDEPFSSDGTPLQQPVAPNAQTQIAAFRSTLPDPSKSDSVRSYDLAWLLHLVGDVHQPLHSTSRFTKDEPGGDAGGNDVKITCSSSCDDAKELHAFWDDLLGKTDAPPQEAIAAAASLDPADESLASKPDENEWIHESFEIAQKSVYATPIGDGDGPFALTSAYQNASLKVAQRQISLAGARLSRLLNEAFK